MTTIMQKFMAAALTAFTVAGPAAADGDITVCTDSAGTVWGGLSYDVANDPDNVTVVFKKPVPVAFMGQDWQGKRPEELDTIKAFLSVDPQGHPAQLVEFHVGPRARTLQVDFEGRNGQVLNTITCPIPRP